VPHPSRFLRRVGFHDPNPPGVLSPSKILHSPPVTSNLAPHPKFLHHCPSTGSTANRTKPSCNSFASKILISKLFKLRILRGISC
jgi:hypothetical protein